MQRLVLAVLFVGLAVAAVAAILRGLRRATAGAGETGPGLDREGFTMQRLAFFVLIALIFYVSVLGAA